MICIAVLDDYQNVARSYADWSHLPDDASLEVFREHLFDEDSLVQRLAPFEVVCAMRERTPFSRSLLRRLPHLKLMLTQTLENFSRTLRGKPVRVIA